MASGMSGNTVKACHIPSETNSSVLTLLPFNFFYSPLPPQKFKKEGCNNCNFPKDCNYNTYTTKRFEGFISKFISIFDYFYADFWELQSPETVG